MFVGQSSISLPWRKLTPKPAFGLKKDIEQSKMQTFNSCALNVLSSLPSINSQGAVEMIQCLRVLAVLPETLGSTPSKHMVALKNL